MENPLSIVQILWVNLVMDTLAALAFGGEPALQRFMKERPKRRDENIISRYMRTSILTGSLWTFALSMVFLMTPLVDSYFRDGENHKYMMTGYFTFYIFIAVSYTHLVWQGLLQIHRKIFRWIAPPPN